ncbi:MAG: histidine triad protein [Francisellaceae bacterium]|nr:histidine triad protein [Francisellaceae bacterium]
MSECLFCNIVKGSVPANKIHEDEHILVFKDIHPKASVHLLFIPKVHIKSLNHLQLEHQGLISHMIFSLSEIAKQMGLHDGFKTQINTGVGGGQIVDHLHFHLLGEP